MRYITLVGKKVTGKDQLRQPLYTDTRRKILADVRNTYRNEFYAASVDGMRPEFVAVVHAFEYEGETVVELEGIPYAVTRAYYNVVDGMEKVELTLSRKVGDST